MNSSKANSDCSSVDVIAAWIFLRMRRAQRRTVVNEPGRYT